MSTRHEHKTVYTANNRDFNQKSQQVQSRSAKLKQAFLSMAGAAAAAFSVGKIIQWGKAAVTAFDKQAKVEKSLLVALKGREDIQQKLIQQAQQLQKETLFGDEETIKAQALAASMGLTYDQISKLIPAAQNLAVATGNTLDFGVKNLARTYAGLSGELGEVIPALRELTQEEMKAGKAIDLVNDLMGGQAKAAAETGLGPTKQLSNLWGDAQENLGQLIVSTDAWQGSVGVLTNKVNELNTVLEDLTEIGESDFVEENTNKFEQWALKVARFTKVGKEAIAEIAEISRKQKEAAESTEDAEEETVKQITTIGTLNEQLKEQQAALENTDITNRTAIAGKVADIQATKDQIAELQAFIDKLTEVKETIEKTAAPDKIEGRTEIGLTGTADDEFNKNLASKLKSTEEYTRKNAALYEELKQKQIQKEREAAQKKASIQQAAFDTAKHLVEGLGNIFSAQKEKELSMVGDNAEKRAQIERKYANIEKGIAIGQATVNTAQAVTKALTAAPPPWNLILAATSGAAGAAQIALIAAQQFAEGGAVSGPTLALVGEASGVSKTNPEYIGTAAQLSQMGVGGRGGGNLSVSIRRDEMIFWLNDGEGHMNNTF